MFNYKFILVFLGIPLGLFCIIFGGMGVVNELNMRNQGQTIQATITESRIDEKSGYLVRYEFSVNGTTYSAADGTGRTNLWTALPSQKTGTLSVVYLPSDPWKNRLVETKSDPMESNLTALVVGLIAFPVGVIIAIFDYKRLKAAKKKE
jgi:hypothetical protein